MDSGGRGMASDDRTPAPTLPRVERVNPTTAQDSEGAAAEPAVPCPWREYCAVGASCSEVDEGTVLPGGGVAVEPGQWPMKIHLVLPDAPFLRGADLLVAGDCAPVVCPGFHEQFMLGRVLLLGCPAIEEAGMYMERFTEIFREADIKSVTVVIMQTPCCQGLSLSVERAMQVAEKTIPFEKVVLDMAGKVVRRTPVVPSGSAE